MAIEVKDLLGIVLPGFEVKDETTSDEIKAEFESKYVGQDLHIKTLGESSGKLKGVTESKIRQALGKIGIGPSDTAGKNFDDLYSLLEVKLEEKQAELQTLKEAGSNGSKEKWELEKLNIQKEISDLRSLNTEKDTKLKELNDALAAAKEDGDKRLEGHILKQKIDTLFSGAGWTADSDKIVRKGIWSEYVDGKVIFKAEGDKVLVYHNDAEQTMMKDGTSQMTAEKFFENTLKLEKRFQENKGSQTPIKKIGDVGYTPPSGKVLTVAQIEHQRKTLERFGVK